jgi:LCP family protein required for cell wall assembly
MRSEHNFNKEIKMPPLVRKKRRKLTTAGYIAAVAFFLLCLSFGFWLGGKSQPPLVPEEKKENPEHVYQSRDILNILLLGVDQRENEPSRTDTIMVVALDLREKDVHLLSIPRDSRVPIPTKGVTRRINYAHAVGGAELTVKTVEQFLQLPIHYYVETNFEGFSKIIDALGGVTINVERRMYKPLEGIDLQAGLQKLNGEDALSYVRWRDDGRADIGRIERQQKFLRALADQAMRFSTLWKVPQLLEELEKYVDTDLKLQQMITLANKFKDIKNIKIQTYQVPGEPDEINYGGSYWIVDEQELTVILDRIYGEQKIKQEKTKEAGTK